ncbi:MAG: DUF7518 family protein [Halapricum sp.]
MCGNRVEELEEHVNQLQATVDGLTDELVECKVRIRELENAVDADLDFNPAPPDVGGTESSAEESNTEDTDPTDEHSEELETDGDSDIIIA